MLSAALKDGANQRFILLSESCIPLYSSLVVYQQLMHEKRSRISACAVPGWDRSPERYQSALQYSLPVLCTAPKES